MKKFLAVLLCICMMASLCVIGVGAQAQNSTSSNDSTNYYVTVKGNDTSNDGKSPEKSFLTLEHALSAVQSVAGSKVIIVCVNDTLTADMIIPDGITVVMLISNCTLTVPNNIKLTIAVGGRLDLFGGSLKLGSWDNLVIQTSGTGENSKSGELTVDAYVNDDSTSYLYGELMVGDAVMVGNADTAAIKLTAQNPKATVLYTQSPSAGKNIFVYDGEASLTGNGTPLLEDDILLVLPGTKLNVIGDYTVPNECYLSTSVANGSSAGGEIDIANSTRLTNNGILINNGTFNNNGTLVNNGAVGGILTKPGTVQGTGTFFVSSESDIKATLTYLPASAKMQLLCDISVSDQWTLNLKNSSVETAGYKFDIHSGGNMTVTGTVKNSVVGTGFKTPTEDRKTMFYVEEGGALTIENGTYTSKAAQIVDTFGTATIKNGIFTCDGNTAKEYDSWCMMVANGAAAKLTVEAGTLTATAGTDYCGMNGVYALNGASIVLGKADGTGPSITTDYDAIGANNTTATCSYTIYGGIYTVDNNGDGTINSTGNKYNAVVYMPCNGNYNISGGTFKTTTGANTHLFSIPYKNTAINLNIIGGNYDSSKGNLFYIGNETGKYGGNGGNNISISGGYFTSDPTAYVAEGKAAVASDKADYNFMIGEKGKTPAVVAAAAPAVENPVANDINKSDEEKQAAFALRAALAPTTPGANVPEIQGNAVAAAASTVANNNNITTEEARQKLEAAKITVPTSTTPTVVVETYMILPTVMRTTQESLKTVPQAYREGAMALGAGKWRTVRTVVLPNAVDGIVTGCILAVGRIVGESAALLFTAGFGVELNSFKTALHSSSATLTVALYIYAAERGETDVAFAIAVILMIIAFLINLAANGAGRRLKNGRGAN